MNGCSCESVNVFETEIVSTWGGLEPQSFGFMPNALTYWAIWARRLLSHVFEYWLWWCRYFWSNVNIWNVNCAGNSIHFRHTNGCSCESVKVFETENVWTWGDSKPQPSDSRRMPNMIVYLFRTCDCVRTESSFGVTIWLHFCWKL